MDVNNGREKMVMKTEVIIIESDTSYDHKPFQVIYAESSDHNPFQATSDESSDHNSFQATFDDKSNHNPFQATSDESSDHNHFQATSDDTLKSSSKDTFPTKRPLPVMNCALGLAAVKTWQQILKREFGIKKPKEMLEEVQM
ncbi:hypothetical protein Tco_0935656 [Tanacetum coccineum]